jgi:phosphatidyl-myo-inositol alpha-mannosyltransferase
LKIALVSPYDFAHPGGVIGHIRALDREFTRRGHTVRIIAPASRAIPDLGERFINMGNPRPIPASGSMCRISLSVHLAPHIKDVLRREQFDVVHLHEPFMPMLCSAMLRFSNGVNIGTFHAAQGRPGYGLGRPVTTFLLNRRNRKLKGRIAVSEAARLFAAKHVRGDFVVIPNGVDTAHFHPEAKPMPEYRDGKLNVLFVGRLEARKGVRYLIEAFAILKASRPECRLLIVGPGTRYLRQFKLMVSALGLNKDVVFVGPVSYDELPRYYRTADIFCSPATGRESFGMVLLEAMASGVPVVASDIEGYRNVVTAGKEGILVPPRNERALAECLVNLAADPGLRRRLAQHGLVTSRRFDWSIIASQVLRYYEQVILDHRAKQVGFLSSPTALRVGKF